ncbi:MAG: YggS family pyridoxal phosphate-dependent enzyme [Treponemataceae bacterium]|nr:YggS family pyridoxal phosphate-dependent enzyme [Treponemataceae bacterium]
MGVKENLAKIKSEIDSISKQCGREGKVRLVAVSKFHPASSVLEAAEAGQILFGENRVQEASEKFDEVAKKFPAARLHIIGHLQRNKVKEAVRIASCIQSVDRAEIIDEIEKRCVEAGKEIEILFEYHTGEESKSGFESEGEIRAALEKFSCGKYPHIKVRGFMTMAPFTEDESAIRASFKKLRELSISMQSEFPQFNLKELSMGMSGDFKIAIEEGSTMVRVGTAIFGERKNR